MTRRWQWSHSRRPLRRFHASLFPRRLPNAPGDRPTGLAVLHVSAAHRLQQTQLALGPLLPRRMFTSTSR